MRDGGLVQYDTPAALYYEPAHLYVCQFVGRTNVLSGTVERVDGDVVVASGGLVATVSDRLQPGMDCAVCVRPERLVIESEASANGDTNALRGKVLERVFLGQTTSFIVELDRGGRVESSAFSESIEAGAAAGDRVVVSFTPESGRVFAATNQETA
jgi:spermidine/putrescine transport system ATP-binding protein